MAWLIVSTSVALKGGWSQAVRSFRATAQCPSLTRLAFHAGDQAHGHGYRAAVFSALPGPHRGTPHARSRAERRGARAHGIGGRALPPAADVTRPLSSAARKTARPSSIHSCSPLQSLCELLARGPLGQALVYASGHLLCVTIPNPVSNQTVHQTTYVYLLSRRHAHESLKSYRIFVPEP